MKLFKNVLEDAFEYNQAIAKLNSRGKPIDIEPVEIMNKQKYIHKNWGNNNSTRGYSEFNSKQKLN